MRKAVSEGRTIVEDIFFGTFTLCDGGFEGVVVFPVLQNLLLEFREGGAGGASTLGHIDFGIGGAYAGRGFLRISTHRRSYSSCLAKCVRDTGTRL